MSTGNTIFPLHESLDSQTLCLPSLTGIAGFFCLRPRRMKKRTSGMKISKASTHWIGTRKIIYRIIFSLHFNEIWAKPSPVSGQWSWVMGLYHYTLLVSSHHTVHRSCFTIDFTEFAYFKISIFYIGEWVRKMSSLHSSSSLQCQTLFMWPLL